MVFMQRSQHFRGLFNHHDASCAARCGFETQGAAAGKQIEAMPAVEVLAEPVEQGFPHAVRCRAQPDAVGEAENATAVLAADDTDGIQSAATVTVIRFSGRMRRTKACLTSSAVTAWTLA